MADYPALSVLIPTGEAIQRARTLTGNPDLTRDGFHLDPLTGRYIAACTWFEAIFGEPVTEITYRPEGMSESDAVMARRAAHDAVAEHC